jgi:sulfur carrier protein
LIQLNGQEQDIADGITLKEVLEEAGYRLDIIAVQVNGDIISKDRYASYRLTDGDDIDVVAFVGGGC